jgi:predicted Zn-dependent protease
MACLDHWLARDPNNVRALELRGITYVTGKGVQRGAEDFRRALELDPSRQNARVRLSICLLDLGSYSEALPLLEQLAREKPGDVEVSTRLARCFHMLGRPDDARRTLDDALKLHPENGRALRTRGQFALSSNPPRLAEAEGYLARAAAALPDDYQAQWFYAEVLRQLGKAEEAKAQVKKAEDVKERTERVNELRSRKLAEQPLDPALHVEMGTLMMRTGHAQAGERWMLSALGLDPDFRPAHAALATYYEGTGDKAKADEHRRRATEK